MDTNFIMNLDIENLKEKKHKILTEHTINILQTIITHLRNKNYSEIEEMLFLSPAGDGYGTDNYVVDFSYNEKSEKDLHDILTELNALNE